MKSIIRLKELLALTVKSKGQDHYAYFKEIAKLLMNQCVIAKGDIYYEIVEIEFYLYSPDHQDVIVYPRKLSAGQWFFHQSGVDLTFESNDKQFGGILIRGIKRLTPNPDYDNRPLLILGPQKCVNELWDNFSAFQEDPTEYPIIKKNLNIPIDKEPKEYPRWIKVSEKISKITYWSNRILEAGYIVSISNEERLDMVFNTQYRFFKEQSIDKTSEEWRKYSAKPIF